MQCVIWTNPGGGSCNMDQWHKWQYLCCIKYLESVLQAINSLSKLHKKRAARTCRLLAPLDCAFLNALLKRTATINTGRCRESDPLVRNRRF